MVLIRNPFQSYLVLSPYGILQCYPTQVNTACFIPAKQASIRFTFPGGMEGWVDLGVWMYTEMVYLYADIHPSTQTSNPRSFDSKSYAPPLVCQGTLCCYNAFHNYDSLQKFCTKFIKHKKGTSVCKAP